MRARIACYAWWVLVCLELGLGCDQSGTQSADPQPKIEKRDINAKLAGAQADALPRAATAVDPLRPLTVSAAMRDGRCATQNDCPAGNVCVAVMPGVSECMARAPMQRPRAAPNGRPAPPVGLLDGRVLREHAEVGTP
jgi:hypothetical protein